MSNLTIKALEHLFISKVRIKALKYFTLNPDRPIHLRGAVREFNEEINAVRRELSRLEETKIVTSENKGNRKYFVTNVEHPFYNELVALFHKTYGLGGEILANLKKLGDVEFALLTPAFTKRLYANMAGQIIDLVIIGTIDMQVIEDIVYKVQNEVGREIHYMIMKPSEFQIRKRRSDQLVIDLILQDNIMLVGKKEEFVS
jgi:hypothetical protein